MINFRLCQIYGLKTHSTIDGAIVLWKVLWICNVGKPIVLVVRLQFNDTTQGLNWKSSFSNKN